MTFSQGSNDQQGAMRVWCVWFLSPADQALAQKQESLPPGQKRNERKKKTKTRKHTNKHKWMSPGLSGCVSKFGTPHNGWFPFGHLPSSVHRNSQGMDTYALVAAVLLQVLMGPLGSQAHAFACEFILKHVWYVSGIGGKTSMFMLRFVLCICTNISC